MKEEIKQKDIAKAYEQYAKQFTPKPAYLFNTVKAFVVGGGICTVAYFLSRQMMKYGINEKDSGTYVTILLVITAQLLTGLGIFDKFATFAGAGVIVPITGFSNSMVAPALEYKKEGLVLGVGSKMFSIAGPVLVCGITSATIVGIIYWIIGLF